MSEQNAIELQSKIDKLEMLYADACETIKHIGEKNQLLEKENENLKFLVQHGKEFQLKLLEKQSELELQVHTLTRQRNDLIEIVKLGSSG